MRRLLSSLITVVALTSVWLYAASGTPNNLIVKTDANNYLLATSVTQTNPVTQGIFNSRILRTDANGSLQVVLTGTVTPTYPQSIPASTCAAPSLGESGAATTGIAFTATPSILNCITGTAVTTLTGTTFTSTVPILLPDGSLANPAIAFASETGMGRYRSSANVTLEVVAGTARLGWDTGNLYLPNTNLISWASGAIGTAVDLSLAHEGANYLIQRNSTNAQRFSVANTYTSASNNELFSVDWQSQSGTALIGTRTAATGTVKGAYFSSQNSTGANDFVGLFVNPGNSTPIRIGHFSMGIVQLSQTSYTTVVSLGETTNTATSGTFINTDIKPTYNQSSGSAANTDLDVNRTQTAVGSGQQLLLALRIGNTQKHYVTADGTSKGTQEAFLQATAPTCTSANNCGTGNGTFATGSSDTAGSVTLGTTPASGFIITFAGTWVAAPVCMVTMNKAGMVTGKDVLTAVTTTGQITVVTNGTAPATGDIYAYRCTGIQ